MQTQVNVNFTKALYFIENYLQQLIQFQFLIYNCIYIIQTLLQLPFHHLKVADLREILKTLGLRKSGNKENLIENLKLYLRKLGQSSDINSLTEVAGLLDRYLPKKSS